MHGMMDQQIVIGDSKYSVVVSSPYMKFNASHFIAYNGFRERLHGHNYTVRVMIEGELGQDGYVMDFGDIKKITREVCKEMNERFLCPVRSDVLKINISDGQVHITCMVDGSKFSFPEADCFMLPIIHSSAEEIGTYILEQLLRRFTSAKLKERSARAIEVSVAEAPHQEAVVRRSIAFS